MEEDYVWLFERVNRFEMAGAVFASVIFHAGLFFVLTSTSYHYPATGNVTKLDILWLYPSSAPIEPAENHPPLADLPGESTVAREQVARANVTQANVKPPTPTADGINTEPPAHDPSEESYENSSVDLIAARVSGIKQALPPVGLNTPKETAITLPGPKPEREETSQSTKPSTESKVATPAKTQEAKSTQPPLPPELPAAAMAVDSRLADLPATQERLARNEANRQHRSAVENTKQEQQIKEAAVIASQKVEQEQLAKDKAGREDLAAFRTRQEKLAREQQQATEEIAALKRQAAEARRKAAEQEQLEKAVQRRQAVERSWQEQVASSQRQSPAGKIDQPRDHLTIPEPKTRQSAGLLNERQRKEKEATRPLQKTVEPQRLPVSQPPPATRLAPAAAQVTPPRLRQEAVPQAPNASGTLSADKSSAPVATLKTAEPGSDKKEEAKSKPSKKPPVAGGMVIASLHGDLKMVIVGGNRIKLFVMFKEYPLSRRKRVLTPSEARREQQVVPVFAQVRQEAREAVIETAREGIYVFSVESEQLEPAKATFKLEIFEAGSNKKVIELGARTVSGRSVLMKVLMPEGISWDDETAFTGSLENSDSTTKFNTRTGLNWREYHH